MKSMFAYELGSSDDVLNGSYTDLMAEAAPAAAIRVKDLLHI
jgi:hypothetical protein